MRHTWSRTISAVAASLLLASPSVAAAPSGLEGYFVLAGVDAKLAHVRAARVALDEKGTPGYAVLLSERVATGPLEAWRMADPAKRGSFIYLMLDGRGDVWVAELGHAARKDGRFGVVTELVKKSFTLSGDNLAASMGTVREQDFGGDRYTVELAFTVPLEAPVK